MTRSWNEPAGATARGTLILVPGRGETAATYERFGTRLAADAYRVRLVDVDLDHLERARAEVRALLADESLPGPKVLVGSDTGASLAATMVDDADAAVLAGLALGGSSVVALGESAVDARTACPVHRRVIAQDDGYDVQALSRRVPPELATVPVPRKPVLVVHGSEDVVAEPSAVVETFVDAPLASVRLVAGGRHDILNDVSHRSVAATIVLFLESLRLGSDLPPVVVPVLDAPHAELERSA
jgi:alpha-beta hydrolase superfamily lysophospholipase